MKFILVTDNIFIMSKSKLPESQQQSQGITIGTQGNDNQPTPHGDDIQYPQVQHADDRNIPHQERSSAANQQQSRENRDSNT